MRSNDLSILIRSVKMADDWFKELQYVSVEINRNRKSNSKTSKVAILDTGMDVGHSAVSEALNKRIKGWKGFPDSADPWKDTDGHGTFLACVLMRAAPQTLLYIARIFNDAREYTDTDVAAVNILKALSDL